MKQIKFKNGDRDDDFCYACSVKDKEIKKLKLTMKLHAGDCLSLSNEVDQMRGHWEAEEEITAELQRRLDASNCSYKALETLYNQLKEETL